MTAHASARIAIVGAGPGGLLAARVLKLGGITPLMFDADRSIDARDQGGSLDLHADSGQIAIVRAPDRYTKRFNVGRTCGA